MKKTAKMYYPSIIHKKEDMEIMLRHAMVSNGKSEYYNDVSSQIKLEV